MYSLFVMTKKKSTHTHVPSSVGFVVLAVMMLGVGLAVFQIDQKQSVTSNAYVAPTPYRTPTPVLSKCVTVLHGKCQWTWQTCTKRWASGYCPGPSTYKCCY